MCVHGIYMCVYDVHGNTCTHECKMTLPAASLLPLGCMASVLKEG